MKKKLLLIALLPLFSFSQIYFSEDFETITDLSAAGWTLYNDTNTPQGTYATIFTDAWGIVEWTGENGNAVASTTSWFSTPAAADRWLVTPAIVLPANANASLTFKIRSHDTDIQYQDGYTLKISTATPSKVDLATDLLVVPNAVNDMIANINPTTVDLSAYNGQTIYLAWVNNYFDGNLLSVDDISVEASLSINDLSVDEISIYPNPANNHFKVDLSSLADFSNVQVSLMDISGRLLKNYNVQETYDISNIDAGTYIVKINDGANSIIQKLIKK